MAGERRGGREQGKSDPIDALAVARAALREPDLPVARLDGPSRKLKLLVDHREDLVRERVRMQARLRWHLHELFPGLVIAPKGLRRQRVLVDLEGRLDGVEGTVARIARQLVSEIRRPHFSDAGTSSSRPGTGRGAHRDRGCRDGCRGAAGRSPGLRPARVLAERRRG